jgi:glutathione S-transferase
MKLLFNPASPFARKVRVVAAEKGLLPQLELSAVNPWTEPQAVTPHNPLGKIPVLVLDSGETLFDSRVICEYLDAAAPPASLLPPAGQERRSVLRRQALADGILDAAVLIVAEQRRPPSQRSEEMLTRYKNVIGRGLTQCEREVGELDGAFNLGAIAVACAVGYVEFRLGPFGVAVEHPKLLEWWAAVRVRSSLRSTKPSL